MGIRDTIIKALTPRARAGGGREIDLPPPPPVHTSPLAAPEPTGGSSWFGPLQPMAPTAPPEVAGRRNDYPSGYNLNQKPRAYQAISFPELRGLADNYDIMRIIIETRKDQMARQKWNIIPRDDGVDVDTNPELKARIAKYETMFRRPDRKNYWGEWLRSILEDLLVIDAAAVHVRRTLGGDVYSLDQIDGATIKVVVDDFGRQPEEPFAAYQQILKGLPAVNYSAKDLLYRPRNRRVNSFYGYSPVEQILMTVQIALRRQMWQLSYFTDGNIPDSLIGVPSTWTPDQIRQFQDWFDGLLTGNTADRRKARFVPGEVAKSYVPTKEAEMFGLAEEWLVKVVCFCFGVSVQPFLKMMARATAETSVEEAVNDGLIPIQNWVSNYINAFLEDEFGETEVMFNWVDDREQDPTALQKILTGYVASGIIHRNEARKELGRDPDPSPEADQLMVDTPTGPVALNVDDQIASKQKMQGAFPPPPSPTHVGPDGKPLAVQPGKTQSSAEAAAAGGSGAGGKPAPTPPARKVDEHVHKTAAPADDTAGSVTRPRARRLQRRLSKRLATALDAVGSDVCAQVSAALRSAHKADNHQDDAAVSSVTVDLDAIMAELEIDWSGMMDAAEPELLTMAMDSGRIALAQVGVEKESDLVDQVNQAAVDFARERSAELVGKRVLEDGSVIDNPNAKWAIDQTTRDMVRETIASGLADNDGSDAIIAELQDSYAFSSERAEMISRTEIANANSQAALDGYQIAAEAGVSLKKQWILGQDPCDICQENADAGAIDLDDDFPSGDDTSPAHPNCECAVIPIVEAADGTETEGDEE